MSLREEEARRCEAGLAEARQDKARKCQAM